MSNTENITSFSTVAERTSAEVPKDWADAARTCVYQILSYFDDGGTGDVKDLRGYIDYVIFEMGPGSKSFVGATKAAEFWRTFGSLAARAGKKYDIFPNFPDSGPELLEVVNQITDILVRKQRDYGHENIARFGRAGLLVRCHDKVARLENLLTSGRVPENESVVDNFIDVIGYSAIGMMWEKQWFLLDLPAAETEKK